MRCAAVIADGRKISSEIVKDHMKHLPDDWFLHVFTYDNSYIDYPHYRRKVMMNSSSEYNELLTSRSFWRELLQYDRVLIFQQDSMLLRSGIEEFLEWDYVGAPWKAGAPWARSDRVGGNGGLSLRSPKACMDLCLNKPWSPSMGNEDVYFSHYIKNPAPYEVCKRFSCETEVQLGTLGHHAAYKHLTSSQFKQVISQYD